MQSVAPDTIDLAFDGDGSLLALEIFGGSGGRLIGLNPDGSREMLIGQGLSSPTAVAIGDDGAVYISNYGQSPDIGEVLRFELDSHVGGCVSASRVLRFSGDLRTSSCACSVYPSHGTIDPQ